MDTFSAHSNHNQSPPLATIATINNNSTSDSKTVKMAEYAKNQPAGFTNVIEKVAVVGVSIPFNTTTYTTTNRCP